MGMEWMLIIALFLISAFVTYGIFANIEDSRQSAAREALDSMAGGGELSARLHEEIESLENSGVAGVRCDLSGMSADDVPALEALVAQEIALAEVAEKRGLKREAEIHRSIAGSVARNLEGFGRETHVA